MALRIVILTFAYLLLGAHFLRIGNPVLLIFCVLSPFLLFIRKRYILIILQIFLYIGAGIWVYTAFTIIRKRMEMGSPIGRVAIILGVVALFTVFSGILLNSPVVKDKYPPK